MLVSFEGHLGGICEMHLDGFRSVPGVGLSSAAFGSCKETGGVLGSGKLTLP